MARANVIHTLMESLNVGSANMFKMQPTRKCPTFKVPLVESGPLFEMHSVGTVPMLETSPIGTKFEFILGQFIGKV